MRLPIFQVDAFTDRVFAGNPAAVVLLSEELPDPVLQAIAAENNLSETAFVLPVKPSDGMTFDLRWFTPTVEVDLCGHATLASGFVLFQQKHVTGDLVRFESVSGPLAVFRQGDRLGLDFPSRPPRPVPHPDGLAEALGATPEAVLMARDLLAVFSSEQEVADLQPRFDRLAALEAFAVCATAPAADPDCDFVSRFFAPRCGVDEDPVTGSAHCTLVPYWAARLGKPELKARQISARGGDLLCEDRNDRVAVMGQAVEYLRGEIFV